MALQPFVGSWPLLQFCNLFVTQTVGLLGQGIRPPQGRYLPTGQQKQRINAHTNIHALSGIPTHEPSVRASGDNSCLRPRSHRDRLLYLSARLIPDLAICTGHADRSNNCFGHAKSLNNCSLLSPDSMISLLLDPDEIYSSETSVTLTGIHGFVIQKIELFSTRIY
jgi:hypothetical protein